MHRFFEFHETGSLEIGKSDVVCNFGIIHENTAATGSSTKCRTFGDSSGRAENAVEQTAESILCPAPCLGVKARQN